MLQYIFFKKSNFHHILLPFHQGEILNVIYGVSKLMLNMFWFYDTTARYIVSKIILLPHLSWNHNYYSTYQRMFARFGQQKSLFYCQNRGKFWHDATKKRHKSRPYGATSLPLMMSKSIRPSRCKVGGRELFIWFGSLLEQDGPGPRT